MLVDIHKDTYGKFSKILKGYENIFSHNDIEHIRLNINKLEFRRP